jgi:hypothetical protein
MSAQQQIEPSMRCLAIDFWRMRKKDGKSLIRNTRGRLLYVVTPKVMRVVDARQEKSYSRVGTSSSKQRIAPSFRYADR